MSVPPTLPPTPPPLRRLPPGVWPALVWCAAALYPVVVYVLAPTGPGHATSYPRDGLAGPLPRALFVLAFLLVLGGAAVSRRRPVAAYALVLAGTVVLAAAWGQDEIPPPQFLGADVALAGVAAVRPRREGLYAAGAALGVLGGYLAVRTWTGGETGTADEPFVALTVAVAWLAGRLVHQARAHDGELRRRAAAEAVTAERLRIAREMHDTVAHSLGIIALQAGAAARVLETRPELAREAMVAVEQAGRETLGGLRRLLGALRAADPSPPGAAAPSLPDDAVGAFAGLAEELERLAARTTAAGVRVEVGRRGTLRGLPPEVCLAAFRIAQEAVTNVVRHSGADSCRIRVDRGAREVTVEVDDRGPGGTPRPGSGFGLAGMRERAALLGGTLDAGPLPGGGFRVTARLPLPVGPGGRPHPEKAESR
ncbi:sensor histidine kinase [Streptomyces sp. NPDC047130]|uniref:sensor histidine kinase n=1 Tax=Streptomyces sp. NPDC047130 TaxID=3155261 RepID=UPI0033C25576